MLADTLEFLGEARGMEIYHCHMLRDEGYTYKEIGAALQITWKRVDYIINKLSLK